MIESETTNNCTHNLIPKKSIFHSVEIYKLGIQNSEGIQRGCQMKERRGGEWTKRKGWVGRENGRLVIPGEAKRGYSPEEQTGPP